MTSSNETRPSSTLRAARFGLLGLASLAVLGLVSCEGSDTSPPAPSVPPAPSEAPPGPACLATPYPAGPYGYGQGAVLPDKDFQALREDGTTGTVSFHADYTPCAQSSKLLILRVMGGTWCGTCLWHAAHSAELTEGVDGARVHLVDMLVGNADAGRARPQDLPLYRAKLDRPERVPVALDPDFTLAPVLPPTGAPLPLYVFVDSRTMKVMGHEGNPGPDHLAYRVRALLAKLDGKPVPAEPEEKLVDGAFTRNEWDMIRDIGKDEPLPPDSSNGVADDPKAAKLGQALFEDTGFSSTRAVGCITCHDPKKGFSDGLARPAAPAHGTRKTPRIALAAFARSQFWDGRADTLWSQALGPFENPDEMDSSRLEVVRRIVSSHADDYRAAFPTRTLPDVSNLPVRGKPGDPSFDALSPEVRESVTRTFVDAGKAIAAYERTLRGPSMRVDAYARGDTSALTTLEKTGLAVFAQVGCMQCHWGPRLTDDAFHATRMATGRDDGRADPGRFEGLTLLAKAEFGKSTRYSDLLVPLDLPNTPDPSTLGAFKTPSLRGIAGNGPYGHAGTVGTLVEVTELYGQGGLPEGDMRTTGARRPWLPTFDVTAQWSLEPFVKSLGK
jgi:cytochrome c peroxidase